MLAALLAIVACSSGAAQPPHPAGWTEVQSTPADQIWDNAAQSPQERQRYEYRIAPFTGDRQDLASREAIHAIMTYPHARMQGSVPFPGCEGLAGLMTFHLDGGGVLEEAFTVHDGNAVTVVYLYPGGATAAPGVADAMRASVCVLPGQPS